MNRPRALDEDAVDAAMYFAERGTPVVAQLSHDLLVSRLNMVALEITTEDPDVNVEDRHSLIGR